MAKIAGMTPNVIFIIYGFFASISLAGVSIVIHNSIIIDKAARELEEEPLNFHLQ